LKIEYLEANCYAYTFDEKKVLKWVRTKIPSNAKVLNLYAGKNVVKRGETRVDSSPDIDNLTHRMTDTEFLQLAKKEKLKYDVIIYDPDWNERKAKEYYEGRTRGRYTRYKNDIVDLLEFGGIIIGIGYEITNFGHIRGMEGEITLVINPKGEIRPYFVSIERRFPSLEEFEE